MLIELSVEISKEKMRKRESDVEDGCCNMHLGALAIGLSLLLVERRVDGKVVNYWKPFQDLFKKTKVGANYIFDKKNK